MDREILVVDGGFGFVKWFYKGNVGKFRSCYKRMGDEWVFGEKALLETGSRYLRTVDELVEIYPLIVKEVERRAKANERDICCVGLPLSVFEGDSFADFQAILDAKLKRIGYREVYVLPQGLGGIKWFLKGRGDFEGNILGIDIGFNTVIVVLYSVREKEILIARTYYKKGVYDLVVSLLMPRIKKFIGERTLTPIELNYLMEHKKLQIGFDVIDLAPEVDESVAEYVEDLLKFIINDVKASIGVVPFEVVVFMGGGANWLRDRVEAKKVEIVILENSEFANVYGFYEKVKEIVERKERELIEMTDG